MAVDPNRIYFLMDKFSRNEVNEAEFNELCELLKDDENESEVRQSLINDIKAASFTELDQAKLDAMLSKVLSKEEAPVRRMFPWRKVVSAAAVIIVVAIGTYFTFFRHNEKPSIAKNPAPVQNDIAPGKDGAILMLANGQQIVLDSAANGKITDAAVKNGNVISYQNSGATEVVYNTMSTPKGRQYSLVLADGSKVWLNAASSIRFPTAFTSTERRVEITGEVYFEVAHDGNKPFHVNVLRHAQDDKPIDVEVLGTHFNINAYSDEESIKTTLLEGSVKVNCHTISSW